MHRSRSTARSSSALVRLPALLLALALGAAPGCVNPADDTGSNALTIVNGTPGGNPAVVVLQNFESGGLCTGALIAERVVLTAKHCVQEAFADGPVSPQNMVVGVGDVASQSASWYRVQSIATTPGRYTTTSQGGVNNDLVGVDVAVMILSQGISGVEPLPLMRDDYQSLGGQTITAVGFGQTPQGGAGRKFTATGRVRGTEANPALIYVGALTCQGDSGGPAITSTGEIAGVVSFGAGGCGSGFGAYNAILPFLASLIEPALAEAGSCLNNGPEICDGADNDCDEMVDEDCIPFGGACTNDAECVGQTCRDTDAGRICTAACDPLRPNLGCDAGYYCGLANGCEGVCTPLGAAGDLPIDADCTSDSECASLFCNDPGDGRARCLQPCQGDEGMCLAGEACAGSCGGCVAAELVFGTPRGLGEECERGQDCNSQMCLEDAGRSYCTRACTADSECADGYHCRDGAVCVAGPRGTVGDPCVTGGDCQPGNICARQGDRSWCTEICTGTCPDGFSCVDAGGSMVCAPDLGLIGDDCMVNTECTTQLCALSGGSGECTRMCSTDVPCAPGFECRRLDNASAAVCVRPTEISGGGCAVSPVGSRGAASGLMLTLLGLSLFVRRRRRAA